MSNTTFFLQIEVFLDFYDSDLDADGFLDLVRTYLATFQGRFLLTIYLRDVIVDVPTWKVVQIRGLIVYIGDEGEEAEKVTEWDGSWHKR
jgi:hypothetical protein